jgi:hypothetical protein
MNIDKARFLLLTTTLAAASSLAAANLITGCSSSSASAADASTLPTESGTDGGTGSDTSVEQTDSGTDAATACLPQGDAGPDAGPDAGGDPFSDCAALMGFCGPSCEGMALDLDLAPGNALLACMTSKVSADACVSSQAANVLVVACMNQIVAQTCLDPTTDSLCSAAVADCQLDDGGTADAGAHAFNKANCMLYTSTLSAYGRTRFQTCITGGTSATTCSDCFGGWQ